jgi:hypothetical protein
MGEATMGAGATGAGVITGTIGRTGGITGTGPTPLPTQRAPMLAKARRPQLRHAAARGRPRKGRPRKVRRPAVPGEETEAELT